ncbi:type 1 glutamine amidotransferase [Paenibacillus glycanilyticus]|uniref:Amidotransferase n=1 Tax=Paenibacillus glycanilyticus TaxID=126569 RepID=A0ABQ6GJY8_9BACL|nr:type 1 glutamine amidotransferase [Paenibacillus glycanilyticus]GLX71244.1 amidotransferase [Paenibacillus glycanilyticus]
MNILAFRHFDFDDSSAFSEWAQWGGHELTVVDPEVSLEREWLDSTDLLLILGGPMSIYQEKEYPWLAEEKRFVKSAMDRHIKIIGICFGAQMLAELLGAKVYRHTAKEIGWHRIERTGEEHPWLSQMPSQFHSFQWHGDTFDLPEGARLLARSEACGHQAFAYGDHVLALQFHLETSPACMEQMLTRWSGELVDSPYIQTAEQIRGNMFRAADSFQMLHQVLDQATRIQAKA